MSDIICPFCKEKGYDLIGLKYHLLQGYCKVFNSVITPEEETALKNKIKENRND